MGHSSGQSEWSVGHRGAVPRRSPTLLWGPAAGVCQRTVGWPARFVVDAQSIGLSTLRIYVSGVIRSDGVKPFTVFPCATDALHRRLPRGGVEQDPKCVPSVRTDATGHQGS